jgi:hypothetical protein
MNTTRLNSTASETSVWPYLVVLRCSRFRVKLVCLSILIGGSGVNVLVATERKIEAVLDRVQALRVGHFAQQDSHHALEAIEAIFKDHQNTVQQLKEGGSSDVITNHCNVVLAELFTYLPILGFLHRSKSASNQFEVYGPLLRLAYRVIGPQTKLVMSSEWNFSPFTYIQMPRLPEFVLIGLPASESNNGLLTPLAGHEFGHTIWRLDRAEERYRDPIAQRIVFRIRARWSEYHSHFPHVTEEKTLATDMFAVQTWLPAVRWGLRQSEEIFCDLIGLWIFGRSYLHAFAYLLAPGMAANRVPFYPAISTRVEYLIRAADEFGIHVPAEYKSMFDGSTSQLTTAEGFLTSLSDGAAGDQVDDIIADVRRYMESRDVARVDQDDVQEVVDSFKRMVPADRPRSLAAVVNAGWEAGQASSLWPSYKQVDGAVVLNELILKSAQILEFRELTDDTSSK